MMHAENGMAIDVVAEQTVDAGTTDPIGHGLARKAVFEGEATNRVIRLAEAAEVPVYIVHLSASEALAEVRDARDRGAKAFAETCPQYLFLSLDDLGQRVRGRQVRVLAAAAHRRTTGTSSGRASSRTTCRSSRPTTARSTSTARRSSARATSARSPTACPASRIASTCCTTAASSAAGSAVERWVEIISTAPGEAVRDVPAEGRDRGRRRRRPRRLRPGPDAHDLGVDPSHGRRLLVLRGPRSRAGATSSCPAARSSSATASSRAARATAGSSSDPRPTTPGWAERRPADDTAGCTP